MEDLRTHQFPIYTEARRGTRRKGRREEGVSVACWDERSRATHSSIRMRGWREGVGEGIERSDVERNEPSWFAGRGTRGRKEEGRRRRSSNFEAQVFARSPKRADVPQVLFFFPFSSSLNKTLEFRSMYLNAGKFLEMMMKKEG